MTPTAQIVKALTVFEAVARHGGFRAAALEIGADHLTVARQVRYLEAKLGAKLFTLKKQRLVLTAKGRSLAQSAMPHLAALSDIIEKHGKERSITPFRVACEPGFLGCWLMPRIMDLTSKQPGLNLILLPASSALHQVDLEADMTIAFTDCVDADDIIIKQPDAIVVCRPDVYDKHDHFPTLTSLLSATLIHDDVSDYWPWWLEQHGASAHVHSSAKFLQVMDARLAVQAASNGLGVALVNSMIAFDELRQGQLVLARPERLRHETYVVRNINGYRKKEARQIVSWMLSASEGAG